ncbi:hypothetical protein Nepgr_010679 [Nepenthes gracilis]|uniref:Uncharacterized protein n=1 Tax=Nepenthes gracilis TaxID=150966 RepID=A0AAD3SDU1_NEPGR|nr:hypothetical protein Nepgr_010679 [Nepenthes gracilis]
MLSPAPAPSLNFGRWPIAFLPLTRLVHSVFEVATLALLICLLILSLLSVSFILYLRIKSRFASQLQNLSCHWSVRFLLVSFISLWSINECFRLPFFRRRYIYPFLPPLSLSQQINFCKLNIILSLGLLQPGFLVSLLFLLNISINTRSPKILSAIVFVALICLPICVLLYLSLHYLPERLTLPPIFHRSSFLLDDDLGHEIVICKYPLSSAIIFGAFVGVYAIVFLLACWKVLSLAINKRIRARINALTATVMICLSVQIGLLSVSVLWNPDEILFYIFVFAVFVSVVVCAAVGESILVIRPISDALSVGTCRKGTTASYGTGRVSNGVSGCGLGVLR